MKKTFIFVGAAVIAFGVYYFFSARPSEQSEASKTEELSQEERARTAVAPTPSQTFKIPNQNSQNNEESEAVAARKDYRGFKTGKVVAKLRADEVGYAKENAGVGIAGLSMGANGRPLIWDRFRSEFYSINERGEKDVVYKMTAADEYIKGATLNRNGDFIGLFGNTNLHLVRQTTQREMEKIPLNIEPDFMNAMRVEARGDDTYLYGVDKTYKVDSEGQVTQFHGAPLVGTETTLDIELTAERKPVITIRDQNQAPLESKSLDEVYGTVQGLYPISDSRTIAIFESDPYLNEFNEANPHYSVKVISSNGEVVSDFSIPFGEGIAVDQPLAVSEDRIIHSVQTENGLEVIEYDLEP